MNCHEVRAQFVESLYGELLDNQSEALNLHLQNCPDCRREWQQMRQSHQLLGRLADREPQITINIASVYRREAARTNRSRRNWRAAALVSAAVAALVLASAGLGLRLELHRTYAVLAWGSTPSIEQSQKVAEPPLDIADPWPMLRRHRDELQRMDELLSLAAREVLDSDRRHNAELSALRRQVAAAQEQQDVRWRLIATELLSRPVTEVALVPRPAP